MKIRAGDRDDSLINSSNYSNRFPSPPTSSTCYAYPPVISTNNKSLPPRRTWRSRGISVRTRGGCHGIQNAWNAGEMDGVEQHLFEAMCFAARNTRVLRVEGRERERSPWLVLPLIATLPCSVITKHEEFLYRGKGQDNNEVDGLAATGK